MGGDHTQLASVAAAPTSSGARGQNKVEIGKENSSLGRRAYQQHLTQLPLPSLLVSLLRHSFPKFCTEVASAIQGVHR